MAEFPNFMGAWFWPWPWIGSYCISSCISHRPLPTYQISLKSKKLFVNGRTDGRTLRPTVLGGLGGVDLITQCIFRRFANKDLGLKRVRVILTKTGARALCKRSAIWSIRRVQLLRVVLVEVDRSLCCCSWWTFWTPFNHWVSKWHSSQKRLRCWRKVVQSLIRYWWIFNAQLRVNLKKWTLKFKLFYPLNHINCFDEICRVCCVNTHIQSLNVWLQSALTLLKYRSFTRGLFLWAHHVDVTVIYRHDVISMF